MAGMKVWVPGEEVLAADLNGYIQTQVVPVFTTAAQRSTMWPTPPKGALSVLADSNLLQYFTGAAWGEVNVSSLAAWSGASWIRLAHDGSRGAVTASGQLRLAVGTMTLDLTDVVTINPPTNMGTGLTVNGYPPDNVWNTKTLRLNQLNPSVGQVGIAFHQQAYGDVIQVQGYRPPAGVYGFHFVNITNTGYVHTTAAAFNQAATARAVDQVTPWEGDAVCLVERLKPVTYRLRRTPLVADDPAPDPRHTTDPPTELGLMAADVADVIPHAVTDDDQGPAYVSLGALVAVLTRAIQELAARVTALEAAAS